MKNDKKILDLVKNLRDDCVQFVDTVESYGNQCAQTDRMLEEVLKTAGEIKKLYDTQAPETEDGANPSRVMECLEELGEIITDEINGEDIKLKDDKDFKDCYDTVRQAFLKPVAYKHINDCWRALEKCQSIEEVQEKFKEFPRWSGEWCWFYDNGSFCVRNDYSDEETEDYEVRELEQLSCEGDEVHWEIIFKESGEEEKVIHYNDADEARADFKYFTEEEPEYYERVILREIIYPADGEEDEIRDLEDWTPDGNKENWDGACPYCGSANIDFVDSDSDSVKYICRNCNEDFVVNDDGNITDRHGRKIEQTKKKDEEEVK